MRFLIAVVILILSAKVSADIDIDGVRYLSCGGCYSSSDFVRYAVDSYIQTPGPKRVVVHNDGIAVMKVVKIFVTKEDTWGGYTYLTNGQIVSATSTEIASYQRYLAKGGVGEIIEIEVNVYWEGDAGSFSEYAARQINQQIILHDWQYAVQFGTLVSVTSSNGFKIILVKTEKMGSDMWDVVIVLDQDGNVVSTSSNVTVTSVDGVIHLSVSGGKTLIIKDGVVEVRDDN